jgi:hypothetical protein
MAHWLLDFLDELTVFWPGQERDGFGGSSFPQPPVQIKGRWQYSIGSYGDSIEYTSTGSSVHQKTSVWVDTNLPVGVWLWKGSIWDIPDPKTPAEAFGSAQIIAIKRVRSIAEDVYLNKVYLGLKG